MSAGLLVLDGLDPAMADAVRYFLAWADYLQIPVTLVSGLRSMEEQAALYAEGRTAAQVSNRVRLQGKGGSVTDAPPGYSAHNYGLAVDIESPQLTRAMALAAQIGFGTVSWDPDHIEWPGWRQALGL